MSNKRVLYKRQTLFVENWRENLLGWLNKRLPSRYYSKSACRRIEHLIDALQTLIRLTPRFRKTSRGPTPGGLFEEIAVEMPREAFNSIKTVQRIISRYPSLPTLGWDRENNLSFGTVFTHLKRVQEEEAEAALAAMSLAEVNELTWLQRCLCGKWFFACRKTQRSCSSTCRHRLYEQTDRFRVNRRKYMRSYYRLKRSGKVK
jgi:hypothetical protein